jgi:hypothetical protein
MLTLEKHENLLFFLLRLELTEPRSLAAPAIDRRVPQGRRHGPSITVQITPEWPLSFSYAGQNAVLVWLSTAFGPCVNNFKFSSYKQSCILVRYEGDARHRGLKRRAPALVGVLLSLASGKCYDYVLGRQLKRVCRISLFVGSCLAAVLSQLNHLSLPNQRMGSRVCTLACPCHHSESELSKPSILYSTHCVQ